MKTYTVIEYTERPDGSGHREICRHATRANSPKHAIIRRYRDLEEITQAPDPLVAHGLLGNGHYVSAEPADPEDLAPMPQSPQHGALREAIATAAMLERTLEQAIEQLARIAGIPQDTAYTCLLSLGDWTPGDPITDEQCKAFIETPQEQPE